MRRNQEWVRTGIGSSLRCAWRRSPEEVRAPGRWRCRTAPPRRQRGRRSGAAGLEHGCGVDAVGRPDRQAGLAGVVEIDATSTSSQSPFPGSSSESAAEGTGFVYDAKGDIVTNEHVVDGASTVRVKFSDGSTYKATVVGKDTSTDIAVLHVDAPASKLDAARRSATRARVAVGDGVVAIGNPFGLDNTVTSGIVSAINREISAPDNTPIEGAIQTDAAINHGNSGGPLFDLAGKVDRRHVADPERLGRQRRRRLRDSVEHGQVRSPTS